LSESKDIFVFLQPLLSGRTFRTMLGVSAWRQHSPSDMLGIPHMTVLSCQDNIDHLPIPAYSVCKAVWF
jgi:hypothetical protein